MTPAPSYLEIATSYGALADLSSLYDTLRDRPPRPMSMTHAAAVECGDGTRVEAGYLTQIWHWNFLSEAMWDSLKSTYRNVTAFVVTRSNDGDYDYYTCIVIFPEEEPEHFAGRVLDAEILLRNLVPYTAP